MSPRVTLVNVKIKNQIALRMEDGETETEGGDVQERIGKHKRER